jgi:flagellar basal-body rod protein FlgB
MSSPWQDPMIDKLCRVLDINVFRSGLIVSNMANVDTPGYRTRDTNFQQELAHLNDVGSANDIWSEGVAGPNARVVRGLSIRPDGNNVSLERESLLLAETQIRFNAGVQLLRDYFKTLLSAIHEGSGS